MPGDQRGAGVQRVSAPGGRDNSQRQVRSSPHSGQCQPDCQHLQPGEENISKNKFHTKYFRPDWATDTRRTRDKLLTLSGGIMEQGGSFVL